MGECRMKTVFTESKRRTIPKRFEECVREDAVSSRLWSWCNILESLSTILPIISIAVDMIAGYGNIIISGGVVSEESVSGANSEKITLFVQYVPILIAMLWKALLIYVSFHCAALLIGALASIVQSTRISSDLALYEISSANNAGDRKSASGTEKMAAAPLGAESEEENPRFPMD